MEQALKVYESELNKKVYVSSKRADMKYFRVLVKIVEKYYK